MGPKISLKEGEGKLTGPQTNHLLFSAVTETCVLNPQFQVLFIYIYIVPLTIRTVSPGKHRDNRNSL